MTVADVTKLFPNQVVFPVVARGAGAGIDGNVEHHQNVDAIIAGLKVLNIAAGVINLQLHCWEALSQSWITIAQTANVNANGTYIYVFSRYAIVGSAFTGAIQCPIPTEWRLVARDDATAKTYGMGYEVLGGGIIANAY